MHAYLGLHACILRVAFIHSLQQRQTECQTADLIDLKPAAAHCTYMQMGPGLLSVAPMAPPAPSIEETNITKNASTLMSPVVSSLLACP